MRHPSEFTPGSSCVIVRGADGTPTAVAAALRLEVQVEMAHSGADARRTAAARCAARMLGCAAPRNAAHHDAAGCQKLILCSHWMGWRSPAFSRPCHCGALPLHAPVSPTVQERAAAGD